MSNSCLGYLVSCVNQTQFLLLLCNASVWVLRSQHKPVPQLWPLLWGWWDPAQAQRGKGKLKPFEDGAVAEIGKAERCFCKGSLAPKPLLLQHSGSEALQRITAGHREEKQAFLSSFLELFFPFGLQFSQKYQSNADSNNTFGPCWLYLSNLLKTRS